MDGQPVSIRIGCHFGPVVLENRDMFGAAVHTANRMTSQAKAGQIITTTATMVEQLSPEWRARCARSTSRRSRAGPARCALFEVLWQTEDVTSMLPAIAIEPRAISANTAPAVARASGPGGRGGRAAAPTLPSAAPRTTTCVVKGNLISRLHARVEINRNKFVLIDQSTNGTFVQHERRRGEAFVRRDSMQIKGEGHDRPRQARRPVPAGDQVRLRRLGRDLQAAALRPLAETFHHFPVFLDELRRRRAPKVRRYSPRSLHLQAPQGRIHCQQFLHRRQRDIQPDYIDVFRLGRNPIGGRFAAARPVLRSMIQRSTRRLSPNPARGTCPLRRGGTS